MNVYRQLFLISCVCATARLACAADQISIHELLKPETRMKAFQAFTLQHNPKLAELGFEDLEKFGQGHADLSVMESTQADTGKKVYVVTHTSFWALDHSPASALDEDAYPTTNFERLFPPAGPKSMGYPSKHLEVSVFDTSGSSVRPRPGDNYVSEGIVRDLNRDGTVEILQRESAFSTGYLTVSDVLGKDPVFVVAFGFESSRPRDENDSPDWGFAVDDPDGDGVFDIVLGPKALDTITPEVTFRWNAEARTWKGPREGRNFRVLDPRGFRSELTKLALSEAPKNDNNTEADLEITIRRLLPGAPLGGEKFSTPKVDEISNPYHYESLAKLSNEEILAYMGAGKTLWDLQRQQIPSALPLNFWKLDAKRAALSFAEQNRPSPVQANFRVAIDDLDGQRAPDGGTLAVSDGPSGCFSPGGAYECFLRCSPEDSFFIVARRHCFSLGLDSTTAIDLRKLPLSYDEARHLIQVTWWLNRVRSKQAGEKTGDGGMGSTSDGRASFRLESSQGIIEFRGTRYDRSSGRPVGVGEFNAAYTKTACLNLVVLLLFQELPLHLGDRWHSLDVYPDQPLHEIPSLRTDYSPEELKHLKASVAEILRLSIDGSVGPEVTREAVTGACKLALSDLRPQLEKIEALLPVAGPREKRLKEIENEIAAWRMRLGPEGTDWVDSYRRRNPPSTQPEIPGVPIIPGLESLPGLEPSPDTTGKRERQAAPSDPKFATLDALYAEKEQLEHERPLREETITSLRNEIAGTLHWFAIRDDSQQLYEHATGDQHQLFPAVRRLRELDPVRAIAAIEYWAKQEKDDSAAQPLLKTIDYIREQLDAQNRTGPDRDSVGREIARLSRAPQIGSPEAQAESLIAVASDPKRDLEQRIRAVELLVPAENPMKYPGSAVDDFLIGTLATDAGDTSYLWTDACKALARRGEGKYWERIAEIAGKSGFMGSSRFTDVLPALIIIAIKEPEPYKARLRELLRPHFENTHGMLDKVFWAAWLTEQRELKGVLERLATSGPADAEGILGSSSSNHASAVEYRFHVARQVVALWNEEDALTRAKLLVGLGMARPELLGDGTVREHLRTELTQTVRDLDLERCAVLRAFVNWCGEHRLERSPPSRSIPELNEWVEEALRISLR